MKKVLIITYYWYPSGGAGVQRWLKFFKYLPQFGWKPVVYTPENPEMPVIDESLAKDLPENPEVLKTKIREPYSVYKFISGRKKEDRINSAFLSEHKKPAFTEKISVWIRGNLFIPDARKFWIRPSVKFLSEYLEKNKVDALVSTGPPHSMHLIAMKLKKKFNIPWLADFRDPWTHIDYYNDLMLTPWADRRHHQLEKKVLETADAVVAVGPQMKREFSEMTDDKTKTKADRFFVITNGYDEEDDCRIPVSPSVKFSLAHVGSLVKSRNPELLWQVLKELLNEIPELKNDLEICLTGKIDFSVMESLESHGLVPYLKKTDYINHSQVMCEMKKAQVLLLLVNKAPNEKGILTGKLFEYLAARRPVLCIGPEDGDTAQIISETHSGVTVDSRNHVRMKSVVKSFYEKFRQGNTEAGSSGIEKFSRKNLTASLAEILNRITPNTT